MIGLPASFWVAQRLRQFLYEVEPQRVGAHSGYARVVKKEARPDGDRLISGKLRPPGERAGDVHQTIEIDGVAYAWSQRHGWMVWGKGIEAVSVSVSLRPGRTRELILDFTVNVEGGASPNHDRLLRALEPAIRSALDAGWDPESRGRAFRHEIADRI